MRATDIIRDLLDLIDGIDTTIQSPKPTAEIKLEVPDAVAPADINHFKQIIDLANQPQAFTDFANQPNEKYADIDSVTTNAGGGVNGPKDPADLKGTTVSLYPGKVYGAS
jgi:hypothetical protein